MLGELGRFVLGGDEDVGEALVVAQQDVEARLQPLDEVGLEQQRFGFGLGAHELHGARRRDHPLQADVEAFGARVVGDARLEAAGLAHIHDLAGLIDHAIDAGRGRQGLDEGADDLGAGFASASVILPSAGSGRAAPGNRDACRHRGRASGR